MTMNEHKYYDEYANFLADRITPSERLKKFVGNNSNLIGYYAEAQVRRFVREIVFPLRVCHGAVIRPNASDSERAKQVDTIIWTPNPLPPLVEVDDFAIVPRECSMGVLEIKSSAYPDVDEKIASVLEMECDLTFGDEPARQRGIPAALGVIGLERKDDSISGKLKEFIEEGKVVVLLKQDGSEYVPNTKDLLRFINFLRSVRKRAFQLGDFRINPGTKKHFPDDCATPSTVGSLADLGISPESISIGGDFQKRNPANRER